MLLPAGGGFGASPFSIRSFSPALPAFTMLAATTPGPFIGVKETIAILVEFVEQLVAKRPLFARQQAVAILIATDGRRNAAGCGFFCGYVQGRHAKRQDCDDEDFFHV